MRGPTLPVAVHELSGGFVLAHFVCKPELEHIHSVRLGVVCPLISTTTRSLGPLLWSESPVATGGVCECEKLAPLRLPVLLVLDLVTPKVLLCPWAPIS